MTLLHRSAHQLVDVCDCLLVAFNGVVEIGNVTFADLEEAKKNLTGRVESIARACGNAFLRGCLKFMR